MLPFSGHTCCITVKCYYEELTLLLSLSELKSEGVHHASEFF